MIEERVPPQNIEAEQAVLGAMLIDKEAIAKRPKCCRQMTFTARRIVLFLVRCWSFIIRMKQ